MLEIVGEGVVWLVSEVVGLVVGDILTSIPWRVWVSAGLVALGVMAMGKACAGTEPSHATLLFLAGIGLVVSPVALFLWPSPPR
ncbi:hypothetical protein [Longimicrobium sp.]|jgi:hypothetical protein|uniref:hypothetical protein n=1 Tax=Longimicrobium sp. TaxID=2029185 RepID=UPI002EDB8180